ncbi:Long-chain-fatty-acid--[acyl-carrier-protein] ligase AEE15, chloroplastic [Cymbomonas tetramitiformis]|uniref:Long-chain-fatty-acid--[acyl-carrier-protein] ligase AEE15, chloroplastic n=1 Tax=Cymbomonas tetramitiformis TaxID=36881 RepID=A0AAE0BCZ3_9CHLO|nr:Long-chain-fatty-acid--[acyl-carrier-protein] ligase AEE15, chloroplastic [Cymbomonas tetramitiformis]KAK3247936.1 Long-chain-fatty-acid--[acyl-carrier-protein] ligase AEE15, chloroplastic [Cymbomonas tetramitiformis]
MWLIALMALIFEGTLQSRHTRFKRDNTQRRPGAECRAQNHMALFAENSHRWLMCDQAIMMLGACDAVRGTTHTPLSELEFILEHSECMGVICEDAETLLALIPKINDINASANQQRIRFAVKALLSFAGPCCSSISVIAIADPA